METWEADGLSALICQSFPRSQIAADVWADEFKPLDKPRAEEAVRRIRKTSEHAPSIAHFHGVYGGLLGTARSPEEACEQCGGSGIVTDTDHPRHWTGGADAMPPVDADGHCNCNVATWCRSCPDGVTRKQMLARMAGHATDEWNAA